MLELDNVVKDFQDGKVVHRVLSGVSLAINPGEYVSIRGQSGCGKSTLLSIMSLLLAPTSGTVRLDGQDVSSLAAEPRSRVRGERMGLVFQNANLVGCLNPVENICLPIRRGVPAAQRRRTAMDLLERVGLADRGKAEVRSLSGGEAQRVALCRALVNKPDFLLCDEPTGALDAANSGNVVGLLEEMWRAYGCALVVVTHDLGLWQRASRRISMAGGQIDLPGAGGHPAGLPDGGSGSEPRTGAHRHALV